MRSTDPSGVVGHRGGNERSNAGDGIAERIEIRVLEGVGFANQFRFGQ